MASGGGQGGIVKAVTTRLSRGRPTVTPIAVDEHESSSSEPAAQAETTPPTSVFVSSTSSTIETGTPATLVTPKESKIRATSPLLKSIQAVQSPPKRSDPVLDDPVLAVKGSSPEGGENPSSSDTLALTESGLNEPPASQVRGEASRSAEREGEYLQRRLTYSREYNLRARLDHFRECCWNNYGAIALVIGCGLVCTNPFSICFGLTACYCARKDRSDDMWTVLLFSFLSTMLWIICLGVTFVALHFEGAFK